MHAREYDAAKIIITVYLVKSYDDRDGLFSTRALSKPTLTQENGL